MAHGPAVVFARPRRSVATSPGQYPVSNGRRPRIASRATHPARPETRRGPAALPSTANAVKQLLMFARRTNALAQSRPCITSVGDRCLRVLAAGEPRDVNAQDCDPAGGGRPLWLLQVRGGRTPSWAIMVRSSPHGAVLGDLALLAGRVEFPALTSAIQRPPGKHLKHLGFARNREAPSVKATPIGDGGGTSRPWTPRA
jgi:hypothetical protein